MGTRIKSIPYRQIALDLSNRSFSSARFNALSDIIRSSGGRVSVSVFPFAFKKDGFEPRLASNNHFFISELELKPGIYGEYLDRLSVYFKNSTIPSFIFTPDIKMVQEKLGSSPMPAAVFLQTESNADPSPIDPITQRPLKTLAETFKGLGVRQVELNGELFYREGGDLLGCAAHVYDGLDLFGCSSFSIKLIKEALFPFMDFSGHSEK